MFGFGGKAFRRAFSLYYKSSSSVKAGAVSPTLLVWIHLCFSAERLPQSVSCAIQWPSRTLSPFPREEGFRLALEAAASLPLCPGHPVLPELFWLQQVTVLWHEEWLCEPDGSLLRCLGVSQGGEEGLCPRKQHLPGLAQPRCSASDLCCWLVSYGSPGE